MKNQKCPTCQGELETKQIHILPTYFDSKWDSSDLHRFNEVRNAQKAQKMNKIALEGRGICHLEAVFEGTKTRHTRRTINVAVTFGGSG